MNNLFHGNRHEHHYLYEHRYRYEHRYHGDQYGTSA